MAKRQSNPLTDLEVGVIRNLLARDGAKGQTIHGQINARRRELGIQEINAARISEINRGHDRYSGIPAVTDGAVVSYFSGDAGSSIHSIGQSPVSADKLRRLFPLKEGTDDYLAITETSQIECKQSFNKYFFNNFLKAIAAFSNNQGGYILFGVENSNWKIHGINRADFETYDRAELSQKLREIFSAEIRIEMKTHECGLKCIGVLYIYKSMTRPVMLTSNRNEVAIGQIYYRYDASNHLIGPSELEQIIRERVAEQSQSVLGKHFKNIMANGIDNSAVLNLTTGEVDGKGGNFFIDKGTLSKVKFVKEGEFVEQSGEPAITIVGQVKETLISKLDKYPFSCRQVWETVKEVFPAIKQQQFYGLIKDYRIKEKPEYAGYSFRTKAKEDEYIKTGIAPSGATSIYNQSAIDFLFVKARDLEK